MCGLPQEILHLMVHKCNASAYDLMYTQLYKGELYKKMTYFSLFKNVLYGQY